MEDFNGAASHAAHVMAHAMQLTGFLPMWVIYDHPRDFPEHFVVRMQCSGAPPFGSRVASIAVLCRTLEEARAQVPIYCSLFGRDPADDPVIVETWL
jgi:hypothetical protein